MNKTNGDGGFLAALEIAKLRRALRLSSLELHLLRTTALADGMDVITYCRDALCDRLVQDYGREHVEARWGS